MPPSQNRIRHKICRIFPAGTYQNCFLSFWSIGTCTKVKCGTGTKIGTYTTQNPFSFSLDPWSSRMPFHASSNDFLEDLRGDLLGASRPRLFPGAIHSFQVHLISMINLETLKNTPFVQYQYNQASISVYPFIYTIVGLSIVSTRLILVTCFRCEWNLMQLNSRVSVCDAFYKLLQKKGGRLVFSIETQWDMELRFETCWKWKDFAVPYAWCRRHIGPLTTSLENVFFFQESIAKHVIQNAIYVWWHDSYGLCLDKSLSSIVHCD